MEKQVSKSLFLNLYSMVIADGIAHPKELETLYRIGTENYGLTLDEMAISVKGHGAATPIPEEEEERIGLLYEMALIANADGEIDDTERKLLLRYAQAYNVAEEEIGNLVDFLFKKAKENADKADVVNELKQ